MMEREKVHTVVKGALLLTLAGLFSKVLSATYRIPLQNLTGDLGFYIYQQIYPLLGMVMILTLYGFPIAISTLTAEKRREKEMLTFRTFYFPLFLILMFLNLIIAVFLYGFGPQMARWIGDEKITSAFQLASFTFLLVPFLSLFRGVSQGHENMKYTAYSQIVEQLIRVIIIIFAAFYIFIGRLDTYQIGEVGVLATMAGMVVAIVLFMIAPPKMKQSSRTAVEEKAVPWKYYVSTCLTLGIVASFNHMILLFMQMVDVFTLVPSLMKTGFSAITAMETKGIFDRGQPLIQLGVVFGSSFALALVPNVIHKQTTSVEKQVESIRDGLLFGGYLAAGATVGLALMMEETNILLFTNNDGTSSLQILALTIVFTTITITAAAVLQSIGCAKHVAALIGLSVVIKIVFNRLLVPLWGINGSAIATVSGIIFLCFATLFLLQRKMPSIRFFQYLRWWVLFSANGMMAIYVVCVRYVWLSFIPTTRLTILGYVFIVVPTGAILYMVLLLKYRVFSKKQIQALPFSRIILMIEQRVQKF